MQEMNALFIADNQLGRRSDLDQLQQRALRVSHGDELDQHARQRVISEVSERRSQSVSRPTGRNSVPRGRLEEAGHFARDFYKSRNALVDDVTEEL